MWDCSNLQPLNTGHKTYFWLPFPPVTSLLHMPSGIPRMRLSACSAFISFSPWKKKSTCSEKQKNGAPQDGHQASVFGATKALELRSILYPCVQQRAAVAPGPSPPGTKADVGTRRPSRYWIPLKANVLQGPNSPRHFGNRRVLKHMRGYVWIKEIENNM